jgi:hypothetical protein
MHSNIKKPLHKLLLALVFGGVIFAISPVISAQSNGAITQGYPADNPSQLAAGSLVSLANNGSRGIELASLDSAPRLVGVVDQQALVAISSKGQEVQVVLNGTTNVLVSDINGPIKAGSKITASPVAGVGMLATADSQIVGTALADFDTKTGKSQTITDKSGASHTISLGSVPLQVGVAYYQAPGSNFLPPFMQNIANSIAGRPVSLIRVLIASLFVLIAFINASVTVYTSVRSAMTSIGRNPMAEAAIRRNMYQTSIVAIVILGLALLAGYLILSI